MLYPKDTIVYGESSNEQINAVIVDSQHVRHRMYRLHARYRGEEDAVPIFKREYEIERERMKYKIQRKIASGLVNVVVHTKTGYLGGNPITQSLNPIFTEGLPEKTKKRIDLELSTFAIDSAIDSNNTNTVKYASICGLSGRLMHVSPTGLAMLKRINPWECVFMGDDVTSPQAALHVFSVRRFDLSGREVVTEYCDYYDDVRIVHMMRDKSSGKWVVTGEVTHPFMACPLFAVPNNDELQGDIEPVLSLQDGYDALISDLQSEIEQMRLAYMVVQGAAFDEKFAKELLVTGAMKLPIDCKAYFLEKNLNIEAIKWQEERLRKNIHIISGTPDMSDEQFAGTQSGVAMKYKMLPLENRCISAEQEFRKALLHQNRLLTSYWQTAIGIEIDPRAIVHTFARNFPQNLLEVAQILQTLKGLVSDKTLWELAPFTDAKTEMARQLEEGNGLVDLSIEDDAPAAKKEVTNAGGSSLTANDKKQITVGTDEE